MEQRRYWQADVRIVLPSPLSDFGKRREAAPNWRANARAPAGSVDSLRRKLRAPARTARHRRVPLPMSGPDGTRWAWCARNDPHIGCSTAAFSLWRRSNRDRVGQPNLAGGLSGCPERSSRSRRGAAGWASPCRLRLRALLTSSCRRNCPHLRRSSLFNGAPRPCWSCRRRFLVALGRPLRPSSIDMIGLPDPLPPVLVVASTTALQLRTGAGTPSAALDRSGGGTRKI